MSLNTKNTLAAVLSNARRKVVSRPVSEEFSKTPCALWEEAANSRFSSITRIGGPKRRQSGETGRSGFGYANKKGGNVEDWQHVKGVGFVETEEGIRKAELH